MNISFIVPTLDEGATIGPLLARLLAEFPGARCIVVDGGSADDTVARASACGVEVIVAEPGRALQMNAGASCADTDYLAFVHADTRPTIDASRLAECLGASPVWGYCQVRLSGRHPMFRVIEWAMNLRSRVTRVATGDQMIFVRRELFNRLGGYRPIPLMEDVELCKRLRHIAPPLVLPGGAETSSRRWEEQGIVATVLQMWLLRLAYFLGVSPVRLRGFYRDAR